MLCGNCYYCPCRSESDVDDGSCTFICICEDVYNYNPRDDGSFCLFLVQYALEHINTDIDNNYSEFYDDNYDLATEIQLQNGDFPFYSEYDGGFIL